MKGRAPGGSKPGANRDPRVSDQPGGAVLQQPRGRSRGLAVAMLILAAASGGAYLVAGALRTFLLAQTTRQLVAARKYEEARKPLQQWLQRDPQSAEAHYLRARCELAAERPADAAQAIDQARQLGFDEEPLRCLAAIIRARGNQFAEAEPVLLRAYRNKLEPQAEVACELARIYLATYRLSQAAEPIERFRILAPEDPRPYLWRNEIESRSEGLPATLIANYKAALERDPTLDAARLKLAEQLAKEGRFEEADHEYTLYLQRRPGDATALAGLGRTALQRGDSEAASRHFEAALASNPLHPEALKELAQLDLRRGRLHQACSRLEKLTQVEPYDADIRYSYAQALRLTGDLQRAQAESERASALRRDNERIEQLREVLLQNPDDLNARFEVTRWMMEHGHHAEAIDWAALILRAEPRHAPTHRLLADHYQREGNAGLANYHRLLGMAGEMQQDTPRSATP